MDSQSGITRILFMDDDFLSYQICQCVASVLDSLPNIELIYASDAQEALEALRTQRPDAVILNFEDNASREKEYFLGHLPKKHPPVVVQTEDDEYEWSRDGDLIYISKSSSLAEMHQLLHVATSAAMDTPSEYAACVYH